MPEGLRNETFYDEEEGTADDEMFLDEDDFQTTSSSVPTSSIKKEKKSKNPKKYQPYMEKKKKLKKQNFSKESKSVHFVYKRDPQGSHDAHSDFCKFSASTFTMRQMYNDARS